MGECLQLKWELGSPVFGMLLRTVAPHDTYEVSPIFPFVLALSFLILLFKKQEEDKNDAFAPLCSASLALLSFA